jgi:hypothetical protein
MQRNRELVIMKCMFFLIYKNFFLMNLSVAIHTLIAGFDSTAAVPDCRLICNTSTKQLHFDLNLHGDYSTTTVGSSPCHADWATLLCQYAQHPISELCSQDQMSIFLDLVPGCNLGLLLA